MARCMGLHMVCLRAREALVTRVNCTQRIVIDADWLTFIGSLLASASWVERFGTQASTLKISCSVMAGRGRTYKVSRTQVLIVVKLTHPRKGLVQSAEHGASESVGECGLNHERRYSIQSTQTRKPDLKGDTDDNGEEAPLCGGEEHRKGEVLWALAPRAPSMKVSEKLHGASVWKLGELFAALAPN
ncbi:hypothetical protein CISG_04123 [Coccidioides immitis RMSCC 3703]|uniref:Uncharacterized protein n=1 Tax=Coccidioides immitis RMSCC 3703 TaxID=454286 RepID=A0A0J8QT18_COCIT|nr:hypothetical protein CISG_04123 [Coccidioides immitis RMSCC 3703]